MGGVVLFLGLLLAAGAVYQSVGTRRAARLYPPPGTLVDIAGQRLHLVRAGQGGPPVLFESGIGASSLSWARVMRDVAALHAHAPTTGPGSAGAIRRVDRARWRACSTRCMAS